MEKMEKKNRLNELNELIFCEVSQKKISTTCLKFHIYILKNKKVL
jgi:hypothetical protein